MLLPLLAMQFTDEVVWTGFDFVIAATLIIFTGLAFELTLRLTGNRAYRAGVGVTLAASFLLLWVNGAVGLIGSEDNPFNQFFYGVPLIALAGGLIARFRSHAMVFALGAAALAQLLLALAALLSGLGFETPVTLFFLALWLGAAWLFHRAGTAPAALTDKE